MSINTLKLVCLITGDKYTIVSRESIKSQDKVTTYGYVILMVMILWFLNAFLLSHIILNYSIFVSLIVSILSMFIVYVVETSIIKMSKINGVTQFVRLSLALLIALIGSISVDEAIFKSDISMQLIKDNQIEVLNSPNTIELNNKIQNLNTNKAETESQILNLQNQMIIESKSGYGPKTKLIERQIEDFKNQRDLINTNVNVLSSKLDDINISMFNTNESGIIKNIMGLIHYNMKNPVGWFIWAVFFLLFLFIESLCIVIKSSKEMTSYEIKRENQDSMLSSQFLNYVEIKSDPIREGLRLLHASI